MSLDELMINLKGGGGSGNFGHGGRKGKRGGSTPKGGSVTVTTSETKAALRAITQQAKRDIYAPKTKTGKKIQKAEDALASKGSYKGKTSTITKPGEKYVVINTKSKNIYETKNLARAVMQADEEF